MLDKKKIIFLYTTEENLVINFIISLTISNRKYK